MLINQIKNNNKQNIKILLNFLEEMRKNRYNREVTKKRESLKIK
jgi:hypothetical protein